MLPAEGPSAGLAHAVSMASNAKGTSFFITYPRSRFLRMRRNISRPYHDNRAGLEIAATKVHQCEDVPFVQLLRL
jgi:hypothetical protein